MKDLWPLVVCCALLVGCSKPYRTPQVVPADGSFVGLEGAAADATTLIMIHGMCHHTEAWVSESARRLADAFGYQTERPVPTTIHDGGARGVSAYRADLVRDGRRLTLYGIVYGPVTYKLKQEALCRDATADTVLCPTGKRPEPIRARLNAELKHTLLDECLADVVVYLSSTGKTIRLGVREALHAIHRDRQQDPRIATSPLFLLSESLGSKVLRDALLCGPDDRVNQIGAMLAYTAQVFLSANQLPLLNLSDLTHDCAPAVTYRGLRDTFTSDRSIGGGFVDLLTFIDRLKQRRPKIERIPEVTKVVAFSDPNDLLSYEIVPADYQGRESVNVRISNAGTLLFLVEDPLRAHGGYLDNREVLRLIRCGHGTGATPSCAKSGSD